MRVLKKVFLALVILMLAMNVFAQTSRTSIATVGTFSTDVDNYMSVNDFRSVEFDKFFTFANLYSSTLGLGFATKFNNIYLGTYYNGELYYNMNSELETTINSTSESVENDTDNSFYLLLGLGNIGIKLGAYIDANSETTNTTDTTPESSTTAAFITTTSSGNDKNNSTEDNSYSVFSLEFGGISFDIASTVLKPYANAYFRVRKSNEIIGDSEVVTKTKTSSTIDGSVLTDITETETTSTDKKGENYTGFAFSLGGDLAFAEKESFESSLGLKYYINFDMYETGILDVATEVNDYKDSVTPADNYTITEETSTVYTDRSNIYQTITPKYACSYNITDKLTIKGLVSLPISFSNIDTGVITTTVKTSVVESTAGNSGVLPSSISTPTEVKSTFSFLMDPDFCVGLQYQIKPEAFIWNFGFETYLPNISYTETTEGNNVTKTTSTSILGCDLSTGFTWILSKDFLVDVSMNTSVNPQIFSDVIDGALSIGVTFKK